MAAGWRGPWAASSPWGESISSSPDRWRGTARRWAGPAILAIGLAVLGTEALIPSAQRGMPARGALAIVLGVGMALPLLGVGCALAALRPWQAALGAALLAGGAWLGLAAREWLITALLSGPATAARLGLPGPIACLGAGALLIAPERLRSWLLPPIGLMIGAMLAIAVKLIDPSFHDPDFLRGALAASLWLLAATGLTARLAPRAWFRIAYRILGSWLIAIGLLLGASLALPRATPSGAPTLPPPQGPLLPDVDPRPTDTERPQSPAAPPGFDPLRQP